jgi:hypothetical protein
MAQPGALELVSRDPLARIDRAGDPFRLFLRLLATLNCVVGAMYPMAWVRQVASHHTIQNEDKLHHFPPMGRQNLPED